MPKLKKKEYETRLKALQIELNELTRWLRHTGKRMVVLFEGRDTAGKGGTINAIANRLNPRQVHVVALAKPSDCELQQWYFQRYTAHLPAAGQMVLFDRSWYNRAGVERVMGFCTDAQYRDFLEQTPLYEKMLVDDGILLIKYWLSVDQDKQEERFAERAADPVKRWKLSPIDVQARRKYVEYGRARDAMFRATHTRHAPWTVVSFNDQREGRLTLIRHLLDQVPDRRVREKPTQLPPLRKKPSKERFMGPVKPIPPAI
ncbi:MAG: polyphosphate kinase 2 [Acidobacteriota bacterium]|nr:polyphosphate kinase 2 [Acidobacteriota bacterium]